MNFGLTPDDMAGSKGYNEPKHQRKAVAETIVKKLDSPHIIALQEVAGDFEPNPDGTVPATQNMQQLMNAIKKAGGPQYRYAEVAPIKNADGGRDGANIRCGFLYRPDRVRLYETNTKAGPTTAASITTIDGQPHLSGGNPVRIDPENVAFQRARKAIVGEFIDQKTGETYFISNVHFTARIRGKRAEERGFAGDVQEAENAKRSQRRVAQATAITALNDDLLKHIAAPENRASKIHVVTLGDLNTTLNQSNDTATSENPEPALSVFEQSDLHRACADFNRSHDYSAHTIREEGIQDTVDHIFVSPELEKRIGKVKRSNIIDAKGITAASDHNPTVININPEKLIGQFANRQ